MAVEIERKFLVSGEAWRGQVIGTKRIAQAYLSRQGDLTIRVRIVDGQQATLTIKSGRAGASRGEFEYEVPLQDAQELMRLARGAVIEKVRHIVPAGALAWEIDVFEGANAGLIVAEIELESEGQDLPQADWIGIEVTCESRYYNSNLSKAPYTTWAHDDCGEGAVA